jgi:hypothetical protein
MQTKLLQRILRPIIGLCLLLGALTALSWPNPKVAIPPPINFPSEPTTLSLGYKTDVSDSFHSWALAGSSTGETAMTTPIWAFSVGKELTWVRTLDRGPEGPYVEQMGLQVPVNGGIEWVVVNYTEGDPLRYTITSFGFYETAAFGRLPIAYANLTVKGVTGINEDLLTKVFPINTNWTQFAENYTRSPPGLPDTYRYEITQDTEDIFEFKKIVRDEYKIPNPDRHGDEGDLYRYDKHRGILLHTENLEWQRSGGYYSELDFLGPPYPITKKPGMIHFDLFVGLGSLLFLATNYRRMTRKGNRKTDTDSTPSWVSPVHS